MGASIQLMSCTPCLAKSTSPTVSPGQGEHLPGRARGRWGIGDGSLVGSGEDATGLLLAGSFVEAAVIIIPLRLLTTEFTERTDTAQFPNFQYLKKNRTLFRAAVVSVVRPLRLCGLFP